MNIQETFAKEKRKNVNLWSEMENITDEERNNTQGYDMWSYFAFFTEAAFKQWMFGTDFEITTA